MARTLDPAELLTTQASRIGEQVKAAEVVRNRAKYRTDVEGTSARRRNPIMVSGVSTMMTNPRVLRRSDAKDPAIQTHAARTYGGTVSNCAFVDE
jgi:hypothetical protein